MTEEEEKKSGLFGPFLGFILIVAIIVGGYGVLRTFVIGTYQVPSTSMVETILVGDRLFADRVSFRDNIRPGDVVTFKKPQCVREEDGSYVEETYVKRVVAMGGQTVELANGYVYVDGVALGEPYVEGRPTYALETPDYYTNENPKYPYVVPEGEIWVMGDNRTSSNDSRVFGSVPIDSVTGRAFFTYWPLSRIGVLE